MVCYCSGIAKAKDKEKERKGQPAARASGHGQCADGRGAMLNEIIRLPGAFQEGRAAGRVSGGAGTLLSAAQHSLAGSTTAAVLPTVPMGHVPRLAPSPVAQTGRSRGMQRAFCRHHNKGAGPNGAMNGIDWAGSDCRGRSSALARFMHSRLPDSVAHWPTPCVPLGLRCRARFSSQRSPSLSEAPFVVCLMRKNPRWRRGR